MIDDLISRQDAIDAIMEEPSEARYPSWYAEKIKKLPSAQRKGKWIRENIVLTSTPPQYQWHCSGCGRLARGFSTEILTDFCPNCGAKMRGEE